MNIKEKYGTRKGIYFKQMIYISLNHIVDTSLCIFLQACGLKLRASRAYREIRG